MWNMMNSLVSGQTILNLLSELFLASKGEFVDPALLLLMLVRAALTSSTKLVSRELSAKT